MGAENNDTPDSMDEIMNDPHKFGAPTFEEYKKNPAKWRARTDNAFAQIADNKQNLRNVREYRYKIQLPSGTVYNCQSLEKVEAIAIQEGFRVEQLKVKPEVRQTATTGYYIEVTFECPRILGIR